MEEQSEKENTEQSSDPERTENEGQPITDTSEKAGEDQSNEIDNNDPIENDTTGDNTQYESAQLDLSKTPSNDQSNERTPSASNEDSGKDGHSELNSPKEETLVTSSPTV